jgi:hypothetical protein
MVERPRSKDALRKLLSRHLEQVYEHFCVIDLRKIYKRAGSDIDPLSVLLCFLVFALFIQLNRRGKHDCSMLFEIR